MSYVFFRCKFRYMNDNSKYPILGNYKHFNYICPIFDRGGQKRSNFIKI